MMLKVGPGVLVLVLLASSLGFSYAAPSSQQDLEPYRGQVIRKITIEGNDVTKDWVIAREVWATEGQSLDPAIIKEDIVRLENLAIFGGVLVTATSVQGGVALNYSFSEMPWSIPYPAMSYTEENGFSLGAGVASPNFGGRNIMVSGSAVYGGATNYSFSASNPWISGNHLSAGIVAFHQNRNNELLDFDQTSDMFSLNFGKYIKENGRLELYGGFYGVGSDQPGITLDPDNYDELWFGAFSLGYDSRDSWRSPHEGWHNEASILYLGGDANAWTLGLDLRRYQPIGERQTIATGPYLGIQTGTVGEDVPQHLQYFLAVPTASEGTN